MSAPTFHPQVVGSAIAGEQTEAQGVKSLGDTGTAREYALDQRFSGSRLTSSKTRPVFVTVLWEKWN